MSNAILLGEHNLLAVMANPTHPADPDAGGFAFQLETASFFIFENPEDGYRSSMASPLVMSGALSDLHNGSNVTEPITYFTPSVPVFIVAIEPSAENGHFEGFIITSRANGKPILTIGTENTDDYYPSFRSYWQPENIEDDEQPRLRHPRG